VDEAIANASLGGLLPSIKSALDAATGDAKASTKFQEALDGLGHIGGYAKGEKVRPEDEAAVQKLYQDVLALFAKNYAGAPKNLLELLPRRVRVSTEASTFTDQLGGITVGLGSRQGIVNLLSTMIHECKHAATARIRMAASSKVGQSRVAACWWSSEFRPNSLPSTSRRIR
jgi:hypothetical protein